MSKTPTLSTATTTAEILEATARFCWYESHNSEDCPIQHIPTETDLCQEPTLWDLDRPPWPMARGYPLRGDLLNEVRSRLAQLTKWIKWIAPHLKGGIWDLYATDFNDGCLAFTYRHDPDRPPFLGCEIEDIQIAFRKAAQDGDPPKHLIVPMVEAWQQRPRSVETDHKQLGILPLVLKATQLHPQDATEGDNRNGQLPFVSTPNPLGKYHSQRAELPFLETPNPGKLVPALPVQRCDLAGGPTRTKGPGAPYAQRLFFEAVMSVPRQDRIAHTSSKFTVTLRDLVAWIWPKGWERKRNLPALARALEDLNKMVIRWERRDWILVVCRSFPTWETKLEDLICLEVFNLPGSDRGPLINRFWSRHWGLACSTAYRSYLRLAYIWDDVKVKRGGRRVFATRPKVLRDEQDRLVNAKDELILEGGQPVKDWSHPQAIQTGEFERNPAADHVPEFGPDDLAELGFNDDPNLTRRQIADRARKTRAALRKMETAGAVVLEADRYGGVRVLEPAG